MLLIGITITMEQVWFEQLFYKAIQFHVRLTKAEYRKFVSSMFLVAANVITLVIHYRDFSNQEIVIKIVNFFIFRTDRNRKVVFFISK